MSVISHLNSISVKINLNNGYNYQTGEINSVTVYLGSLNPATYDAAKVLAVIDALEACLTKTISSIQEVRTSTLYDD